MTHAEGAFSDFFLFLHVLNVQPLPSLVQKEKKKKDASAIRNLYFPILPPFQVGEGSCKLWKQNFPFQTPPHLAGDSAFLRAFLCCPIPVQSFQISFMQGLLSKSTGITQSPFIFP